MPSLVLVHGSWHGGWCWRWITPLLERMGMDVFTPTLTGLGETFHLSTVRVELKTHVADVTGLLINENLTNVVLVGHSYAGMVITGVADIVTERLSGLIF